MSSSCPWHNRRQGCKSQPRVAGEHRFRLPQIYIVRRYCIRPITQLVLSSRPGVTDQGPLPPRPTQAPDFILNAELGPPPPTLVGMHPQLRRHLVHMIWYSMLPNFPVWSHNRASLLPLPIYPCASLVLGITNGNHHPPTLVDMHPFVRTGNTRFPRGMRSTFPAVYYNTGRAVRYNLTP